MERVWQMALDKQLWVTLLAKVTLQSPWQAQPGWDPGSLQPVHSPSLDIICDTPRNGGAAPQARVRHSATMSQR